jgi:hypothetical protein
MPRYSHPDSGRLAAFALGKLAEAQATEVADHCAGCEPCQHAIASVPEDSVLALVRATPSSSAFEPSAAADSWVPPELIGHPRYRLLEWLGAGAMGVVFKAEHRLMQRSLAIKVISRILTNNPVAVDRFKRDVKAAARLCHANIVTAHDAERIGGLHCLVMEYVEARTWPAWSRSGGGPCWLRKPATTSARRRWGKWITTRLSCGMVGSNLDRSCKLNSADNEVGCAC